MPRLFRALPPVFAGSFDAEQPWRLLGEPLTEALAGLPTERIEIGLSPDHQISGDRIVVGAGTRIHPTAVVEGPIYIGRDVHIRPGAYLRGGCWIEDGAIVGANTEVKHSIFLAGARAPHLAYVGDSILGAGVNLGAGTVLSNFRHDGTDIVIPGDGGGLATGRRKLGALLGDGVQTGCNCVLHPGSIVGTETVVYAGVQLRAGVHPAERVIKLRQQIETVERHPRAARDGE